MIQWVRLGSGRKPVPEPAATGLVWAGAFGGALTLVALINTMLGPGRPHLALTALSLLAAALGVWARFTAAPGTAVLCWLFLNGFAIPPEGVLTWAGSRDALWLGCLLAAALVGTTTSRLAHARAAYHRLTTATDPDDGRLL
ncbi:hypothetical protein GCM10009535_57260 [Streptomyces thermocarboxydovorans]|uniref:Histidine kinase n=1 Tax=Streptomyces thermocarboxydovorans TaxID=59298 RepID=A0ABN1HVU8_9ACTN